MHVPSSIVLAAIAFHVPSLALHISDEAAAEESAQPKVRGPWNDYSHDINHDDGSEGGRGVHEHDHHHDAWHHDEHHNGGWHPRMHSYIHDHHHSHGHRGSQHHGGSDHSEHSKDSYHSLNQKNAPMPVGRPERFASPLEEPVLEAAGKFPDGSQAAPPQVRDPRQIEGAFDDSMPLQSGMFASPLEEPGAQSHMPFPRPRARLPNNRRGDAVAAASEQFARAGYKEPGATYRKYGFGSPLDEEQYQVVQEPELREALMESSDDVDSNLLESASVAGAAAFTAAMDGGASLAIAAEKVVSAVMRRAEQHRSAPEAEAAAKARKAGRRATEAATARGDSMVEVVKAAVLEAKAAGGSASDLAKAAGEAAGEAAVRWPGQPIWRRTKAQSKP